MFPEATLIEEVGIVFLGFIDPVEKPPVGAVQFTISGIPCPPQGLNFRITEEFGEAYKLPFCRLEKPVIIGPEKKFRVAVNPDLSETGKCQPLALLITTAEKMSMA
ncbi:unnamed protein product [marine sediment metagenome]|uniref:Uncharacterized protein n=1 Tax=marine sediment metagenome TaxID=412755 RepID=X1SQX0_9ZZZZ